MVAETGADFAQLFFGIVYAGAWPVPLPLPTSFGGKDSYIDQLNVQLTSCDPMLFLFPRELADMAGESGRQMAVESIAFEDFIARDAMPCGGRLKIETSAIALNKPLTNRFLNLKPGEYIRLRVIDSGDGITEEVLSRIFEPFYRVSSDLTDGVSGTGIGLAISRDLARLHGGDLVLEWG